MNLEQADHTVLHRDDEIEYRLHDPCPMSETTVLRYSDRWDKKSFLEEQSTVRDAVDGASVNRVGRFENAVYDCLYMPPLMHRNDIVAEVGALPLATASV